MNSICRGWPLAARDLGMAVWHLRKPFHWGRNEYIILNTGKCEKSEYSFRNSTRSIPCTTVCMYIEYFRLSDRYCTKQESAHITTCESSVLLYRCEKCFQELNVVLEE